VKTGIAICCALLALAGRGRGQEVLDQLDDALDFSIAHDQVRARLSGLFDVEEYYFQHPAPGLIDTANQFLFNPRLKLFLDAQLGPSFYLFAQARVDRGFDPSDQGATAELDEYALRFTPWDDGRFNVQIGKSATIFGGWVKRHLPWENPFVSAPLPYENVLRITDSYSYKYVPGKRPKPPGKYARLPVIWGPDYTTGITLSGHLDRLDYAAEIKNAPLASRPQAWSGLDTGFEHPSYNARVGFQPDPAWNLGASAGDGIYLRDPAAKNLPRGLRPGQYREIVIGQDASYASGHFQIWAELFESRFTKPAKGDLDAISYYLEGKYKFTPQMFAALRWNQQMRINAAGSQSEEDTRRIDAALGYRFTPHLQLKLQYSFQFGNASFGDGSMLATQITARF
jgi:hypothetical protein